MFALFSSSTTSSSNFELFVFVSVCLSLQFLFILPVPLILYDSMFLSWSFSSFRSCSCFPVLILGPVRILVLILVSFRIIFHTLCSSTSFFLFPPPRISFPFVLLLLLLIFKPYSPACLSQVSSCGFKYNITPHRQTRQQLLLQVLAWGNHCVDTK